MSWNIVSFHGTLNKSSHFDITLNKIHDMMLFLCYPKITFSVFFVILWPLKAHFQPFFMVIHPTFVGLGVTNILVTLGCILLIKVARNGCWLFLDLGPLEIRQKKAQVMTCPFWPAWHQRGPKAILSSWQKHYSWLQKYGFGVFCKIRI